jgi:hypothetical protein
LGTDGTVWQKGDAVDQRGPLYVVHRATGSGGQGVFKMDGPKQLAWPICDTTCSLRSIGKPVGVIITTGNDCNAAKKQARGKYKMVVAGLTAKTEVKVAGDTGPYKPSFYLGEPVPAFPP